MLRGSRRTANGRGSNGPPPTPAALLKKEPSVAHGIPRWEDPTKAMDSELGPVPKAASQNPKGEPKNSQQDRFAHPGERRPMVGQVVAFNREDSFAASVLTCDQSEIPVFAAQGNSVQQQRYAPASPITSSPRRKLVGTSIQQQRHTASVSSQNKPNNISSQRYTAGSPAASSRKKPISASAPRSPQKPLSPKRSTSTSNPPRKSPPQKSSYSPRKTPTRNRSSPLRSNGQGGVREDIVLDIVLPSFAAQEEPEGGEIVLNLSQAPLSDEGSGHGGVVIPSFGKSKATKSNQERRNRPLKSEAPKQKLPPVVSARESEQVRGKKPMSKHANGRKEAAPFRPPAPLHDSNEDLSFDSNLDRPGSSHHTKNSRSSDEQTSPGSSPSQQQQQQQTSSASSDQPPHQPPPVKKSPTVRASETSLFGHNTLDNILGVSLHGVDKSTYEIPLSCDSSESDDDNDEDGFHQESSFPSSDDIALLEQENEMIKLAMERSMKEFSFNSSVQLSVASSHQNGEGVMQSKTTPDNHAQQQSVGVSRGKPKNTRRSDLESKLMSIEEPVDCKATNEIMSISACSTSSTRNDRVTHASRFSLQTDSLASAPNPRNEMSDSISIRSRYDSVRGANSVSGKRGSTSDSVSRFGDSTILSDDFK